MKKFALKYKNLLFEVFRVFFGRRVGLSRRLNQAMKIVYLAVTIPIEVIGDIIFIWKRFRAPRITDPRRILIVKVDRLGDLLFSTFLLPLIKGKYPNVQIDYLIDKKCEGVLKGNPYVSKIYFWKDPLFSLMFGRGKKGAPGAEEKNADSLKALRENRYDVVINARPFPPSSNIFWKLLRPRHLVAFNTSEESFLADAWADCNFHEEEWKNYLNLLAPLGIDVSHAQFDSFFANIDGSFTERNRDFFSSGSGVVTISPVTFDSDKNWPVNDWKKVVAFFVERRLKVVLTGLRSQENYLREIAGDAGPADVKIACDITIEELAGIIKNSVLFMGIDSFPAHLSVALKKEAVCFVNEKNYFFKGLPRNIFANGSCLLPIVSYLKAFSVSSPADPVIGHLKEVLSGGGGS